MPMRFPFQIDGRGCTATAASDDDAYIRDLMEQILMTTPGERINRPDFGSGVLGLLFAPGGDVLAQALQTSVQAALQRWLAELVQILAVNIETEESTVEVTVQYVISRTQQPQVARFSTALPQSDAQGGTAT